MNILQPATFALALLASGLACADEYAQFPGAPIDTETLRIKEKVEEIYSSGNYERAMLLYEKELAPKGDKYAQYMTGYMHLTGRGVEADPAEALAWYRLAAERGEPKFIEARDQLYESLDDAELENAAERFADLWQHYGDKRLILDLIREDLAVLRERSGNGLAGADPGSRIGSGYSETVTGDPYYGRVRAQLAERLQYLNSMGEDPDRATAGSRVAALEARVRQELRNVNLP